MEARTRFAVYRLLILLLMIFTSGAAFGAILQANAMNSFDEQDAAALNPSAAAAADGVFENSEAVRICVAPGDTLWSIARQYGPEGMAIRTYVQQIMEANALSSASLHAGQVLILP